MQKKENDVIGAMVRLQENTHNNVKRFIIGKKDHTGKRLSLGALTQYVFDLLISNKNLQNMLEEAILIQQKGYKTENKMVDLKKWKHQHEEPKE